jgi:hypothetical protein
VLPLCTWGRERLNIGDAKGRAGIVNGGLDRVEVLTWLKMGGRVGVSEIMGRLEVGTDTSPGGISP